MFRCRYGESCTVFGRATLTSYRCYAHRMSCGYDSRACTTSGESKIANAVTDRFAHELIITRRPTTLAFRQCEAHRLPHFCNVAGAHEPQRNILIESLDKTTQHTFASMRLVDQSKIQFVVIVAVHYEQESPHVWVTHEEAFVCNTFSAGVRPRVVLMRFLLKPQCHTEHRMRIQPRVSAASNHRRHPGCCFHALRFFSLVFQNFGRRREISQRAYRNSWICSQAVRFDRAPSHDIRLYAALAHRPTHSSHTARDHEGRRQHVFSFFSFLVRRYTGSGACDSRVFVSKLFQDSFRERSSQPERTPIGRPLSRHAHTHTHTRTQATATPATLCYRDVRPPAPHGHGAQRHRG